MEISDIVYLAFSTVMVVVVLHIGVFWIARVVQPPKPKVVYVDRTPLPAIIPHDSTPIPAPPPPQIVLPPRVEPPTQQPSQTQTLNVPTYAALPLPIVQSNKADAQLPPPIETREVDKVGWSGGKS
jgi:hypothetical protein